MQRLTIQRVMLITIFALLFVLSTRIPVDSDTWWHLRSGEYTLTRGMIYTDPFSHTFNGQPWINHSWGSQVILYGAWRLGGSAGLALYTAVLATGGMAFAFLCCSGSVYLRGFALVLGGAAAAVFWSARPQMLSFFLSAVILYLLHLYKREGKDRLWLIPPIMLIWGNLHAGFSIGFILLGGSIAGEIANTLFRRTPHDPDQPTYTVPWQGIRKLILVSLVSAAALVVNPYGFQMLTVPFQTVSLGVLRDYIQEWNSPNFHGRETWPFVFLLLGVLGAAGGSRRRLDWTDFFLVSGTAFMALLAGRNISLFAVVATPVLTYHLDALLTERNWIVRPVQRVSPGMARINLALLLLVLLGAAGVIIATLNPDRVDDAQRAILPLRVTEALNRVSLPGRMFNSYNWGGYLMFAAPQYPVFVDGRTDLYGDAFLSRWFVAATGGSEWRAVLDEYQIQIVVVENGSGLAARLSDAPDWTLTYSDEQAVIYTREALP